MNKNLIRKFATAAAGAALVVAPAIALAPAAIASPDDVIFIATVDPTPAGDQLGVIHTDGEQDIVAITTPIDPGNISGEFGIVGEIAYPCEDLDESVRVPIEGQEHYCHLDRSHLARLAPGEPTPATVPDLDPSLGIMPISAPINIANPATDAATAGKWLSIALSALAVGGTAVSLSRRNRREVTAN